MTIEQVYKKCLKEYAYHDEQNKKAFSRYRDINDAFSYKNPSVKELAASHATAQMCFLQVAEWLKKTPELKAIKKRLEYLRGELKAERVSYGELAELQSLADYIEPGDVELLEAAGVPEFPEEN